MERSWHIQQSVQYIWVSGINLDSIKAPFLLPHKVKMQYISTCGYLFNKKKPSLIAIHEKSLFNAFNPRKILFMSEKKGTKKEMSLFSEMTSILPSCLKLSIRLSALLNSGLNMHVVKLWEVWNTKTLLIILCGVIRLFYTEASKLFSWNYRHCIHLQPKKILTDCRVIGGWVVFISDKRKWWQVSMCTILRRWLVS